MARYKRYFVEGHGVFITIVTHRRNPILIENIDLLRASFRFSKSLYRYRIDAIVVLPDHFHIIITPERNRDYPHIARTIKQRIFPNTALPATTNISHNLSANGKRATGPFGKRSITSIPFVMRKICTPP